jgi:hypothetical protein
MILVCYLKLSDSFFLNKITIHLILDISIEVFKFVLVFLLSIGDFNLLISNEINFLPTSHGSHHKKTSSYSPSITILFNVTTLILNFFYKNSLKI